MGISIVIPTINEGRNIKLLINGVRDVVGKFGVSYEIIVVDGGSTGDTEREAISGGATFYRQKLRGYGNALKEGFNLAKNRYILTMDADLSHELSHLKDLWDNREKAELVIASRYVKGGRADVHWFRKYLSMALNEIYTYTLSLPYKDISSGLRLYDKRVLEDIKIVNNGFSTLQELLTKIHCNGYRIIEIPFCCKTKRYSKLYARLFKMALSYFVTLFNMWKLRHSLDSADYDETAYNSRILPQRYWQRKKYNIIMKMLDCRKNILDIGCGSSRIVKDLSNSVGLDINHKSLRYLRKDKDLLVEGSITELPFRSGLFKTIICSELIEHIPREDFKLEEMERALMPNGIFILATPDYSRKWWCFIEWIYKILLPGAYGEQHITHYTSREIVKMFTDRGWRILNKKYVLGVDAVFKMQLQNIN